MDVSYMSIDEIILQSGLRINNSISDPLILAAVSVYGYDQVKLTEGQTLLSETSTLVETQKQEYGELDSAQSSYEALRKVAHKNYMVVLAICQIVFKTDVKAISTLSLTGRRAATISGWLNQTTSFYHALLANEDWKLALTPYGQTAEILTAHLDAINEVATAFETVKKEKGDAQNIYLFQSSKLWKRF